MTRINIPGVLAGDFFDRSKYELCLDATGEFIDRDLKKDLKAFVGLLALDAIAFATTLYDPIKNGLIDSDVSNQILADKTILSIGTYLNNQSKEITVDEIEKNHMKKFWKLFKDCIKAWDGEAVDSYKVAQAGRVVMIFIDGEIKNSDAVFILNEFCRDRIGYYENLLSNGGPEFFMLNKTIKS